MFKQYNTMRYISFALKTRQIKDKTATVTRRDGWWNLQPGTILMAAEKCQGLKKGEKIARITPIRVVSVRSERLRAMTDNPEYGRDECRLEGFPGLTPEQFVAMFCRTHKGCTPDRAVNRIEFEYV